MDRPPGGTLGGLAGQRITLHRKKFHFCIVHIILNKIDVNLNEKSLDLVNFVNFAEAPQGGRGYYLPLPYWRTLDFTLSFS